MVCCSLRSVGRYISTTPYRCLHPKTSSIWRTPNRQITLTSHLNMLLLTTVLFLLSAHNSLAALPRRPVYHGPRTPVVDLSTTAPPSNPIPRSPFKQTSREAILARAREKERRKNAKIRGKRQAAAAQASATVYPSCAGMANKAAIQQTGFADLSPWYISRTAPYDVVRTLYTRVMSSSS